MEFRKGSVEVMVMNASFWHNKRVLVTGHTGFKGGWLALWLRQLGAQVTGISLEPDTSPSLYSIVRESSGLTSYMLDIRQLQQLQDTINSAQPEIVFHLAAQPLVSESYIAPVQTFETNVIGTVNILEACRQCSSIKCIVNITSDKCYDNKEWVWGYRENDELGGNDPYSASKACAELVTRSYIKSFFQDTSPVAIASARAGNVIGGGDWAKNRLIPDLVRTTVEGGSFVTRDPDSVRPWQHVLEPLHGYLLLAERLSYDKSAYTGAWNFGPQDGNTREVNWIIHEFSRHWGKDLEVVLSDTTDFKETRHLQLNSMKAIKELNWKPKLEIEQAIAMTVAWYKAFYNKENMLDFTIRQINQYQEI